MGKWPKMTHEQIEDVANVMLDHTAGELLLNCVNHLEGRWPSPVRGELLRLEEAVTSSVAIVKVGEEVIRIHVNKWSA